MLPDLSLRPMRRAVIVLLTLVSPLRLSAAQAPAPIQDNSFLIEEAYNQEAGVVQHISTFSRSTSGSWLYGFTQEWPLGGVRHQLSYSIAVLRTSEVGLGDFMVSYRLQAVGDGGSPLAIAPRASLLVPTGSVSDGHGVGGAGLQAALPVSWRLGPSIALMGNVGVTWVPDAGSPAGHSAATIGLQGGGSLIWSPIATVNFLVESLVLRIEQVAGQGAVRRREEAFLNPGVRAAINTSGGWQIVPGLAYTVGIGPSSGDAALFLYLSVEHPFGGGQ